MSTQLKQAVAHIKSGDKKAGKTILLALLNQEPTNSRAWMILSAVVDTPEMKRKCLEEAIGHDPDNETARQVLARLNQKYPPPPLNLETAVPFQAEEQWLPDSFKTSPAPAPPEPSPAPPTGMKTAVNDTQRRWESSVIRDLAAYRRPRDIAAKIAQKGMDYNHALGFVLYVSRKKKRQIALRRMPIVLLIAIPTFLWGFLLLGSRYQLYFGWPMVISSFVGTWVVLKDIFSRSE